MSETKAYILVYQKLTVIGSVLFSTNHSLRVEKRSIGTCLDLVDSARLEINVQRPRNVFSCSSFGEKGGESAVVLRFGSFNEASIWL